MGGEAELVPGNNTAIYGAIDRSKGEIEVHLISGYLINRLILTI